MPFFPAHADTPTLAVANVGYWFQLVGVSISVYSNAGVDPIYGPPEIVGFELEHGKEQERYAHNSRSMLRVRREGRSVLAEHAGFWDLFVPVGRRRDLRAIFMTGPFSRERPTPAEIRERWQRLTGHPPKASDPEFARYVEATFATPLLDAKRLASFEHLLAGFAELLVSDGDAAKLRGELRALQDRLAVATRIDKMWEVAASMIGSSSARSWSSQQRRAELSAIGVRQVPNQLFVGLCAAREAPTPDPVDELVHRHAFLRACADLGRRHGDLVCGRLGDRGVVLLMRGSGARERRTARLVEIADAAHALARRFDLRLHVGIGTASARTPLNFQFERALGASELALSRGARFVHADPKPPSTPSTLGELRRELTRTAHSDPSSLPLQFHGYAETAAAHTGYLLEPLRAHLEAGFERVYDVLVRDGGLDAKSAAELLATLDAGAGNARSVVELVSVFRTAVESVVQSVTKPRAAQRDRSLARAVGYIRENYAERELSLNRAARIAGFAGAHFSELFKQEYGVTFSQYVNGLRIEQAKRLLMTSALPVERVAELSGFPEKHYFHRAFRKAVGTTPRRYRNQLG